MADSYMELASKQLASNITQLVPVLEHKILEPGEKKKNKQY